MGGYSLLTVELIPDAAIGGFTARVPDIPAFGEGQTREQAIGDLKEALRGYIEAFGLDAAVSRLRPSVTHRRLRWDLTDLACG